MGNRDAARGQHYSVKALAMTIGLALTLAIAIAIAIARAHACARVLAFPSSDFDLIVLECAPHSLPLLPWGKNHQRGVLRQLPLAFPFVCTPIIVVTNSPIYRHTPAFTFAHSLTLGLVTLGLVTLPPRAVEAAIALSIILLAREALQNKLEAQRPLDGEPGSVQPTDRKISD